jgi:hypothetical protein
MAANVKEQVVNQAFDKTASDILAYLREQKTNLAPTFAFIDPFGYSGLPMDLLAELLAFPRTEIFVNFMVGYVQRFLGREGQENVMRELFGMDVAEFQVAIRWSGVTLSGYRSLAGSRSCLYTSTREGGTTMSNGNAGAAAGGGAIYGLGIFGALVYFWQQADTFWEYLLAVFQGLFWPAWMVYEIFAALAG